MPALIRKAHKADRLFSSSFHHDSVFQISHMPPLNQRPAHENHLAWKGMATRLPDGDLGSQTIRRLKRLHVPCGHAGTKAEIRLGL